MNTKNNGYYAKDIMTDGKYNVVNKSLILSNLNPDSGDHDWKEILEYRDWSVLKFFSLSKAN